MATRKSTDDEAATAQGAGNAAAEAPHPADKHQLIVTAQREFIGSIADRIERGEPFARAAERKLIAGILRAWARQIPDALPAKAAKVDPGYVAIHFAWLVNGQGLSKSDATADLAKIYDVTPEAISGAIEKFEASALRLVAKKHDAPNS